MKLERFDNEKKPKIMIIPMIDIIFFLLVFFMMSMLSMVTQRSIGLNLPQTSTAVIETTEELPISIAEDGTIYVEKEAVSKSSFRRRMEIELSRNHDVKVLLRADKNSQHGDFVFVLDQLKALGIHRISIATESN